ncbi:hypothetical protein [Campylobacter sp.]|uniref:hypothetical protein n=1 Tax=Campylobacter sp. TaxID=205 RepID=UPI003618D241
MKFKKWTFSFFTSAALIFAFVAAFNYLVDPYMICDTDIFKNKPREDLQSRFMKVVKIQKIRPASIFLGNSRPQTALNPAHRYFTQPAFNAAVSGGNLKEAKAYLKWAIRQGNLKQALFVFDDKTMLGGSKADDFEEYFKNPSAYKILFSFQMLRDSVATVLKYGKTPLFEPDDRRTEASLLEEVQRNGGYREYSVKKIESGYMAECKRDEVSRLSYENFIEILTDAHENNVTLDIAISPLHARLLETMDYRVGLDVAWYEWKKQIATVNEEVAKRLGKKPFRIVDFGLYSEITAQEPPKDADQISPYYWEASHYNAKLGDMMLDFLTKQGEHAGLGVEITSKNIDAHIEKQKSLRAKFIDTREYRREVLGE